MSAKTRDQPDCSPPDIATPQEVLMTLTQIMRGTMTETAARKSSGGDESILLPPKISERSKAAEMLGKRYGLFSDKEHSSQPREEIIQQIEDALAQLMEKKRGSDSP